MKQDISLSINLDKIDKSLIYESPKNGKKYLNLTLILTGEKGQYGDDGFIKQIVTKERKLSGERDIIIGNAKIIDWEAYREAKSMKSDVAAVVAVDDDDSSIPF
jgi:hypothetical protein